MRSEPAPDRGGRRRPMRRGRPERAQSTRDALEDRLGEGGDAIETIVNNPDTLLRCRPESEWLMTGG